MLLRGIYIHLDIAKLWYASQIEQLIFYSYLFLVYIVYIFSPILHWSPSVSSEKAIILKKATETTYYGIAY